MKRVILTTLVLAMSAIHLPATEPPIILLKIDDLVAINAKWQRVVDFIVAEDLKANLGVIGFALEKEDPTFIAWVKDLTASGRFEVWNHGYAGFGHPDEFVGTGYEAQAKAMARSQELSVLRFGAAFTAFGPHSSQCDADTWKVLAEHPEINLIWFQKPPSGVTTKAFLIDRAISLEKPIFVPNPESVRQAYETKGKDLPYIALQGHPAPWNDEHFVAFQETVRYLKGQGCRFMLASEFLATQKP